MEKKGNLEIPDGEELKECKGQLAVHCEPWIGESANAQKRDHKRILDGQEKAFNGRMRTGLANMCYVCYVTLCNVGTYAWSTLYSYSMQSARIVYIPNRRDRNRTQTAQFSTRSYPPTLLELNIQFVNESCFDARRPDTDNTILSKVKPQNYNNNNNNNNRRTKAIERPRLSAKCYWRRKNC